MVSDERRCQLLRTFFAQRVDSILETYTTQHPDEQQSVARARLQSAVKTVCRHYEAGARVLDLGSGCGLAATTLADLGFEVTAVDLLPQCVEAGREKESKPVNWRCEPFSRKVGEKGSFDVVLALGFLEYQERAGKELVKMRQLLKPGGTLVLSVPNTLSARFKFGLDRAFFRLASEPEEIPVRHSFTPERLQRLLGMAGFIFLDYQWLPDCEGHEPLAIERNRDLWAHRVRWRTAPEFISLSRTYRPEDTEV